MNEVVEYLQNRKKEVISKRKSHVGYYADVDGDGIVDGIIFADLAIGGSGKAGTYNNGLFSYDAITGTKDYYVSQTNYEGSFGTKDVLTATGSGKDRFYVMALKDVSSTETTNDEFTWYDAAAYNGIDYYDTVTSESFGSGKTNTETMVEKWNNKIYGEQNAHSDYLDIWGVIQQEVADGGFIASREEWSAFVYNLEITEENYSSYGLKNVACNLSSLDSSDYAWMGRPYGSPGVANIGHNDPYIGHPIRLTTCF